MAYRWDVTPAEARAIQTELAANVVTIGDPGNVRTIMGVDVGAGRAGDAGRAAVVLVTYPDFAIIEQRVLDAPVPFPYIPGLLSFREAPLVLAALETLETRPDLLFVDGQGVAHPRRFGIASHLGVLLDLPTIGCAKSRLVGEYDPVGPERGATSPLLDRGERIGSVVRSREGTRPLFVSPGHRIGFEEAVQWTLACCRFRLPEPVRLADRASKRRDARR